MHVWISFCSFYLHFLNWSILAFRQFCKISIHYIWQYHLSQILLVISSANQIRWHLNISILSSMSVFFFHLLNLYAAFWAIFFRYSLVYQFFFTILLIFLFTHIVSIAFEGVHTFLFMYDLFFFKYMVYFIFILQYFFIFISINILKFLKIPYLLIQLSKELENSILLLWFSWIALIMPFLLNSCIILDWV